MKNTTDSQPLAQEQKPPQVQIVDHYIKNISFDSMRNANSFTGNVQPQVDTLVDVFTTDKGNSNYEVALHIKSDVSYQSEKIFNLDLIYAAICILDGIREDGDQKAQVLNVYCPNLIFPFVRRVVADVTRDGGFPPMLINGLDFAALYRQNKLKQTVQ